MVPDETPGLDTFLGSCDAFGARGFEVWVTPFGAVEEQAPKSRRYQPSISLAKLRPMISA